MCASIRVVHFGVSWKREAKGFASFYYLCRYVHYSYLLFRFWKSVSSISVREDQHLQTIQNCDTILVNSTVKDWVLCTYVCKAFCLSSLGDSTRNAHRRLNLVLFNGPSKFPTCLNLHGRIYCTEIEFWEVFQRLTACSLEYTFKCLF